jgi:8-oxo-dGTP pyrophosphatase MutT (NUDIX family)
VPISDYLRRLREKVGTDLVLMPAAAAITFDGQGRVLLVHQTDNGRWGTPGGSMEPDESPADAAVREMWEETGLLVEPMRVLGVYGGPEFHATYSNGDEISYLGTIFECRVVGGRAHPDQDEVSAVAYFSREEVASLGVAPLQRVILDDAFDERVNGSGGARFRAPTWQPPADSVRTGGMSGHLRDLRKKVGHDLLFVAGAGALILDERGHILLQQRADNGRWHPPAGAVEPHEHPADAAVREVWEETGLLVEPMRIAGIHGGEEFYATYPNGDRIAVYSVIFECRVIDGQACPDGVESLDVGYFPLDEARGLMPGRWWRRVADALNGPGLTHFDPPTWRPPAM